MCRRGMEVVIMDKIMEMLTGAGGNVVLAIVVGIVGYLLDRAIAFVARTVTRNTASA